MPQHPTRRSILRSIAALPAAAALGSIGATQTTAAPRTDARAAHASKQLVALESRYDACVGVYARNLRTGRTVAYRSMDRFPVLSTFKTLASADILRNFDRHGEFLARVIRYSADQLVVNSPITSQHVDTGMSVGDLCAAAIQYSDNTAGNLILAQIGGLSAIGRFARSLGDYRTRLDRWEPDLNTAIPGDLRDTTTPTAIGRDYAELVVGRALDHRDRAQLTDWLKGNTTSALRFRAGLPAGWTLADKTGAGDYGTLNDIGIAWTTCSTPILLTALTRRTTPDAVGDPQLLADIARLLASALAGDE